MTVMDQLSSRDYGVHRLLAISSISVTTQLVEYVSALNGA